MDSRWTRIGTDACSAVESNVLAAFPEIAHGVTTRQGGLNLSLRTHPNRAEAIANRASAARLFGADLDALFIPEQVHGNDVAVMCGGDGTYESDRREADAVVTNVPGILLGITIADCLPVFLYDPANRAIGLGHSGWRGTATRIVPWTLDVMQREYGTDSRDVIAAVGPGICGRCYEVGGEVRAALLDSGASAASFNPSPAGRWMLDLASVVRSQLIECGVVGESISQAPWCTFCNNDIFFSHRKEGPMAGRLGAFIRLKPPAIDGGEGAFHNGLGNDEPALGKD